MSNASITYLIIKHYIIICNNIIILLIFFFCPFNFNCRVDFRTLLFGANFRVIALLYNRHAVHIFLFVGASSQRASQSRSIPFFSPVPFTSTLNTLALYRFLQPYLSLLFRLSSSSVSFHPQLPPPHRYFSITGAAVYDAYIYIFIILCMHLYIKKKI